MSNTGARAGDEVVQVYLIRCTGRAFACFEGFKRIHREAGQKQTAPFTPGDRDLSFEDESGQCRIVAGDVQIWIGGGQPSGRLKAAGLRFNSR